jgi:hypothetical protein
VIFPGLPIILTVPLMLYLYKMFGDPLAKWSSWQNNLATLVFVTLNHYQSISLLGGTAKESSGVLGDVVKALGVTNDMMSIFNAECLGYSDFESMTVIQANIPVVLALSALMIFACSRGLATLLKRPQLQLEPNRLFNAFMGLIYTFFSAISALSMSVFKCKGNPNNVLTLASDLSVVCHTSDEWKSVLAIGLAAVAVYCIGCGSIFVWAIWTAQSRFSSPDFQMRWKFLFIKYRSTVWWWSLAFLTKNFFFNIGFVIFT